MELVSILKECYFTRFVNDDDKKIQSLETDSENYNENFIEAEKQKQRVFEISKIKTFTKQNLKSVLCEDQGLEKDFLGKKKTAKNKTNASELMSNDEADSVKTKTLIDSSLTLNEENLFNENNKGMSNAKSKKKDMRRHKKLPTKENFLLLENAEDKKTLKTKAKTEEKKTHKKADKCIFLENCYTNKNNNSLILDSFNDQKSANSSTPHMSINFTESGLRNLSYLTCMIFEEPKGEEAKRRLKLIQFLKLKAENCKRDKKYLHDAFNTHKIIENINKLNKPIQAQNNSLLSENEVKNTKPEIIKSLKKKIETNESLLSEETRRIMEFELQKKLLEDEDVTNYECTFPHCDKVFNEVGYWKKHYKTHLD